jgi:erythromycin esterase-like protein
MHAYNQSRPPRDRVAFYGLDLWNNGLGREFIRQYLRRHAPDELRPAEDLFARLASLEKKWPMQVTDSDRATLKELAGPLAALTRRLESHGAGADDDRSADARRGTAYARVMEQWVTSNTPEGAGRRSEFMATNLRTLAESLPDTKFVVWAHDSHIRGIGREAPTGRATAGALLGEYMRRAYGGQYFAFGLEFNEGGYLTRDLVEGHPPGDFRVVNVPSAPTESVPWYLSRLGVGNLVVGFRDRTPPHPVLQWLAKAQVVHDVWWGYVPPDNIYAELPLRPYYDGMVFIEKTTATRPTASAKQAVAERAEFRF